MFCLYHRTERNSVVPLSKGRAQLKMLLTVVRAWGISARGNTPFVELNRRESLVIPIPAQPTVPGTGPVFGPGQSAHA